MTNLNNNTNDLTNNIKNCNCDFEKNINSSKLL